MINTLLLPELREFLAANDERELREFCAALNPSRAAEFMEGLNVDETWRVLQFADLSRRAEIFLYLKHDKQAAILANENLDHVAELVAEIPSDDRVDLLQELEGQESERHDELVSALPDEERRDYLRLSQYPEGTAGAKMTTEVAKLSEELTIHEALNEIGRQADLYETIYYLFIVDREDRLRGLVSARQLLTGMRSPETKLKEIMDTDLVTADVLEDQESVANKVARLDLLAIPVVDSQHTMLGIITHDDVIDVVRKEATEDAHRIAGVDPLDDSYLRTSILTLSWKRGMWLGLLFFFALLTAFALEGYEAEFKKWVWLVPFIPLVISSGGNTGSQSATLIITALSRGHITLRDYRKVIKRELVMGLLLGGGLGLLGLAVSWLFVPAEFGIIGLFVVPITLLLVVVSGTITGSVLPLVFERLGWDPAMMSNPFVAGIIDIVGILIYVNVAMWFLG